MNVTITEIIAEVATPIPMLLAPSEGEASRTSDIVIEMLIGSGSTTAAGLLEAASTLSHTRHSV